MDDLIFVASDWSDTSESPWQFLNLLFFMISYLLQMRRFNCILGCERAKYWAYYLILDSEELLHFKHRVKEVMWEREGSLNGLCCSKQTTKTTSGLVHILNIRQKVPELRKHPRKKISDWNVPLTDITEADTRKSSEQTFPRTSAVLSRLPSLNWCFTVSFPWLLPASAPPVIHLSTATHFLPFSLPFN